MTPKINNNEQPELDKVFAEPGQVQAEVIQAIERPEIVEEAHLTYLDQLRESGDTNMFGATPYLLREFPELGRGGAQAVLGYWMDSYTERHPVQQAQTA